MIKLEVFSAAFLLGLFLTPVSAEAGRPLESEKASDVNFALQNDERLDREIEVSARSDGERIVIYATFLVPVGPQQAWAVLTDFDNIPNFISSVQFSKIINRTGNNLRVSQRGTTSYGFITYAFDSVGEVQLSPFSKIQERMVSGSMRKMEEITVLLQEGHQTRITYHADIVPGHWIPKVPGQFLIENDARERFRQIKVEMIKRGKMLRNPANIR